MKSADRGCAREQLVLFERRPTRTSWSALPLRVRHEVVRLLAKMLVDRRTSGCRSTKREGEVR